MSNVRVLGILPRDDVSEAANACAERALQTLRQQFPDMCGVMLMTCRREGNSMMTSFHPIGTTPGPADTAELILQLHKL